MAIIIKYFGAIADATAKNEERFDFGSNGISLSEARQRLESQYPKIKLLAYSFAINQVIATDDKILNENDELALLPPFAGG